MKPKIDWTWKNFLAALLLPLPLAAAAAGVATCNAPSSAGVNFGDVTSALSTGSPINSTGSISVTCNRISGNPNVSTTLALSAGGGNSGFSPRKMQSGGSYLGYNLYTDSARTLVWGDGTGGTQTVSTSLNANPSYTATFTIYTQILGSQQVTPAGNYSDTIIMTLTYTTQ